MKTHCMNRLLVVGAFAIAVTQVSAQTLPPPPKPVIVKPSKTHEKCMQLDAGQKIEYRFESAKKMNFNLNYRKSADEVYYPVKLDRTMSESGLFEAKMRNRYCLVWENRTDADIELTYTAKVTR